MKSLLAFMLAAFACQVLAAPHDPAPLPDDVVAKLLHEPYRQPVDPLAQQLQRRLGETEELVRRWQREAGAAASVNRAQQLEAQIDSLTQMKAPVQQRLLERQTKAVEKIKGKKARASELKAQGRSADKLLGQFDRLHQALGKIETAATPEARSQALASALDLLRQTRGRLRDREEAPSAVPWPTARLGGEAGPSPRKRVDAVPKYLAEQQARYLNSVASNGAIVLAAAPATPAEAGQCYTGGTVDAADLAATLDAQKDDPEIAALAEKLGHSPAKILAWVHDNIRYEPYWGSLKGARGALVAGGGNATDQASLMIALLRASNIPARYVSGEIQITDPAPTQPGGRALRWLGAKTYVAAANILAKGGIPAGLYGSTGIYLDHVWVEACVPYSHYRGAAVTNAGHRWVPLDAAFKDRAYRQDIDVNVSFDYGFDSGDYLAARSDQLPHERYALDVEAAALAQGKDLADLSPEGGIRPLKLDILPASLPYTVSSFIQLTGAASVEPSELPGAHRYALDVTVKSGSTALLTRSVSYPDAALKRLTLSFTPADASSQTWWDGWNGSFATLPASGVNVKPVLKLEGAEVAGTAAGSTALTASDLLTTIIKLRLPDSDWGTDCVADSGTGNDPDVTCVNKTVYDNIKPGGYHALQAHAFQTSDRYLKERAQQLIAAVRANPAPTPASPAAYDATLGEFLHLALAKYLRYGVDSSKQVGDQMNVAGQRGNDIGLTTVDLKTEYLFDQPYAIKAGGLLIDVKGGQARYTKLDTVATDAATLKNEIWPAFKLAFYSASAFEHYIWQEMARTDAVSTVRGLQFARQAGTASDIVTLDAANIAQYDTLMDASMAPYKTQITNYVNAGATVTVPKKKLAYSAEGSGEVWNGAVYMAENQGQGSFGALISGNFGGGYGALTPSPLLTDFNVNYSLIDPAIPSSLLGSSTGYFSLYNSTTLSDGFNSYQSTGGDPVNLITGNFYHVERDLSIAGRGGLPLVFERSYNSRQPRDGVLGFGWTHSFNHVLKFYGVEGGLAKLGWIDGTGGEKFFGTTSHTSGNIAAGTTLTNPDGIYVVFKREADGKYKITEKNGLVYTFESVNGTAADTGLKARLLSVADRNGNTLALAYNGDGTLRDVTDGPGRKLAFTYTAGRIAKVEFKKVGGAVVRTHEYTYDAAGNLASHKSPATLLDAAKAPPVTYQYYSAADGTNLDHAMKQYQLPRGNGMSFHYYADGRVFRHAAFGPGGEDLGQAHTFRYNTFRRETVQINERGLARTFIFDANGNPASITEENGAFRSYAYDPARPLNRTSKTDPYGLTTQYQYDTAGNVTRITQPDGNAVEFFDFTAFNQPRRVKDARGNWTLFKYDAKGNLTDEIKLKAGVTPVADTAPAAADVLAWTKHRYDSVGNRTGVKPLKSFAATLGDFNTGAGPVVATAFDADSLYPVSVSRSGDKTGDGVDDAADSETLAYDDQGRETRGIDEAWHVVQRQYDAVDRVVRATDALGQWRDYAYDANGNPVEETLTVGNARVDSASAVYDGADRRVQSLDAAGNASAWELDARGNPVSVTDADGYSLGFEYDAMDRWVTAYDKAGNSVTRSLDISGRQRAVTDPNGNTNTQTWWDASRNGRLKESIDAAGRKTAYDYDANGNVVSVTDNAGQVAKIFYDALNRPVRSLAPLVDAVYPVTCRKYDALGRLTEVWAGSTTDATAASCDLTGTDPDLKKQTTAVFNDFGWQVKETDPLGNIRTASHDRHGNVLTATDAKGQTTVLAWTTGHQLASRTVRNADGSVYKTETFTRNPLGQPEKIVSSNPVLTETRSYDPAHRLVGVTDSRGNKTLTHHWSPGGLLNTVEDSDGHRTDYLYDGTGRLIGIWAPNFDYLAFSHDAGGRLTEKWFPNGTTARYAWNADDSLAELTNRTAANSVLSSHQYSYDSLGRRYRHAETLGSLGTKYLQYGFDALSRLTAVESCTGSAYSTCTADETLTYDIWDNRKTRTAAGSTLAYVHDAANQLTEIRQGSEAGTLLSSYAYDANGNLTSRGGQTLTWTPDGRLAGIGAETYAYDAQDRRIQKTVSGQSTSWHYNGPDIHAEWNAAAPSGAPQAVYTHGPAWDDPLIRTSGSTSGPDAVARYYHADGLSSAVAMSGNSQTRINAVAGRSVTKTAGSLYSGGYGFAQLTDGDRKGANPTAGGLYAGTSGSQFELVFDGTKEIEQIDLFLGQSNYTAPVEPTPTMTVTNNIDVSKLTVEYWTGTAWANVAGSPVSGNVKVWVSLAFAPVSTTKIRVTLVDDASNGVQNNDNVVTIAEIEAWATPEGGGSQVQRFDAWGNKTQTAGAAIPQYGYTGREPDATGLIYYRARYYDPTIGRFISRDPAGMPDGINRYSYVRNNPVNFTDPLGLYAKKYNTNTNTAKISYALDALDYGGVPGSGNYSLSRNNQPTFEEDPFAMPGGGIMVAGDVTIDNAMRAAGLQPINPAPVTSKSSGNFSWNIPVPIRNLPTGINISGKFSDWSLDSLYIGAGVVVNSSFSLVPRASGQVSATQGNVDSGFASKVNVSAPFPGAPSTPLGTFGVSGNYLLQPNGSSISGGPGFVGGRPSASATWGYNFDF